MTTIQINVSGYISEVVCGRIPIHAKEAFGRYILENRNEAEISAWLKKRKPSHISKENAHRPQILAKSKLYSRVTVCYRMPYEISRKNIW